jgi:hypothetical protein
MNKKRKEQKRQYDLKHDKPFKVNVGKRSYKCKYLKTWTSDQIASIIVLSDVSPHGDMKETVRFISKSGTMAPKMISMLILGSYLKIKLFHWILWRYIYITCTPRDYSNGLSEIMEAMDMGSFFLNIRLAEAMNTLRMQMTQEEARSFQAELQSEKKQPSETSSHG